MSIRIGIYDFFAFTVPGGLMLLILLGVYGTFGGDPALFLLFYDLGTFYILLLILLSYLTGFVANPFLTKWGGLFEQKNMEQVVLDRIKSRNPALDVRIEAKDWGIWFATIRRENLDLAIEIDRNMAVTKMLRGLSAFLFLAGILLIANITTGRFSAWWLPASLGLFICSYAAVYESVQSKKRFFYYIFETAVSKQPPFSSTGGGGKHADRK
ncbi:MAG: hypothetical protein H6575_07360 [Lewinellaceae bacterium]|nr:hypothetical protein [Saprospiraceae bacterium]MCB9354369.1 hypothetical protein [Lewinellaceae bacterium]